MAFDVDAERQRLLESRTRTKHWRRWGPYLSERQWGTVREDYSADGDAWSFVSHDMARSYAYRWGEDGLGGISDNHQRLCFAVALWNGHDSILKERLFGLTNPQGNQGEDVKECYWYLDSTPTHSYMRYLYRYPHAAFPYQELITVNAQRDKSRPEFELEDTGIFNDDRFFDIGVEYGKADAEDVVVRIRAVNRAAHSAPLWLLPTLWFRNDWSWTRESLKPKLELVSPGLVRAEHHTLGTRWLSFDSRRTKALFTENETNRARLYDSTNPSPRVKDSFHEHLLHGTGEVVVGTEGTKSGYLWTGELAAGEEVTLLFRLSEERPEGYLDENGCHSVFEQRRKEADLFYQSLTPAKASADEAKILRLSYAGLLWSKQWYFYSVEDWLEGDPAQPNPPPERLTGRNHVWKHLYNDDVLAMPDKWEYPWYAVWDSAFHAFAYAMIDPRFAKRQLDRFTREWYMHPNGQLPAYEWSFSDVNPPVHAWATYRTFKIAEKHWPDPDEDPVFLERVFHKLLMNFTWWVNRKDTDDRNLFEGGFLGMDNIGVFDRSAPLPDGVKLLQSDGTSWMAMYCLNMLRISGELAVRNPTYEDIASKFYEHFLFIANAMNVSQRESPALWCEEDGFYYDHLSLADGRVVPLKIRSMVGLVPLFAVETLEHDRIDLFPGFRSRMEWFDEHRPDLVQDVGRVDRDTGTRLTLLSLLSPERLVRVLAVLFDEDEFLSPFGIRSLSKYHAENPFRMEGYDVDEVRYEPGESTTRLFGGNSNWRGPVWFPMNFLLIEALQKYDYFWRDTLKVEYPTRSGNLLTLGEIAQDLSRRLVSLFIERDGVRPAMGSSELQSEPLWKNLILFHEYFHAETGKGLGASHQTGWTALVSKLIFQSASG